FEELLNVDNQVIEAKEEDEKWVQDDRRSEPPTREEVRKAIGQLKAFKAAGPDGIVAEVPKACGEPVVEWVHRLIRKVWDGECVVEEWRTCTIVMRQLQRHIVVKHTEQSSGQG